MDYRIAKAKKDNFKKAKKPKTMHGVILPTFNVTDHIKEDIVLDVGGDEEE